MADPLPVLAIVVPCFDEEAVLPETARRLRGVLDELVRDGQVGPASHVLFVDDGSRDGTWRSIEELLRTEARFGGLKLSRNSGHQNALLAGLLTASGDLLVSIDADLQDDPNAIRTMVAAARAGSDIVYGVRGDRSSNSAGKRWSARAYYRLLEALGVEIVSDHADFRLMSRRAVEALREYREANLFLRALIPRLGFQASVVRYERAARFAGRSKYPVLKMLALALEGITSFSSRPLRLVTALGLVTSFTAAGLAVWALAAVLVFNATVPGWASTVIPIYLIFGVQLFSLGIIGEYVGKIYLETKRRPRYHIEQELPSAAVGAPPAKSDELG